MKLFILSISAICTLARPWEAVVIGAIGAILACLTSIITYKLKIDDPVGVVSVHAVSGLWGLLSVGKFNYYR